MKYMKLDVCLYIYISKDMQATEGNAHLTFEIYSDACHRWTVERLSGME